MTDNNPYKPGTKKENRYKEDFKSLRKDADFLSAGLNILVCFLLCGSVGYYADYKLGVHKWTSVGVIVGLIVGFYYFVRIIIDAMKNK